MYLSIKLKGGSEKSNVKVVRTTYEGSDTKNQEEEEGTIRDDSERDKYTEEVLWTNIF